MNKYLCLTISLAQLWPAYFYTVGTVPEQVISHSLLFFTTMASFFLFFRKFKIAGREVDLFACEEVETSIGKQDGWVYSEAEKTKERELGMPYMPIRASRMMF